MAPESVLAQEFSVGGEVVEIFEARGERRARIVLRRPAVIDVGTERFADVQLGDQVVVDGWLRIDRVRASPGPAVPGDSP